jgi:hypothetical protein
MFFSMGGKNKRISDKNKEEMSGGFPSLLLSGHFAAAFQNQISTGFLFGQRIYKYIEDTKHFFASL